MIVVLICWMMVHFWENSCEKFVVLQQQQQKNSTKLNVNFEPSEQRE